jgi:hypothetical protein
MNDCKNRIACTATEHCSLIDYEVLLSKRPLTLTFITNGLNLLSYRDSKDRRWAHLFSKHGL